jgi:ketosteroid isomerase-like protein
MTEARMEPEHDRSRASSTTTLAVTEDPATASDDDGLRTRLARAVTAAGGTIASGAKTAGGTVGHAGASVGRATVGAGRTVALAAGTARHALRPPRRRDAEGDAALIRRAYRAIAKQDLYLLRNLFADDAVWHVPGESVVAGTHEGPEAIAAMFGKLRDETDGTVRLDLHDVAASPDHVVALQGVRAHRDTRTLDAQQLVVFHVHAGKIREVWGPVSMTQPKDDAFWGTKGKAKT